MKNIIMALGDNAKFYPNYLTNHVASDFKIHLESGIGEIISERNDLRDSESRLVNETEDLKCEIEDLRGVLSVLSDADNYSVSQVRMAMRKSRLLINK